MIHETTHLDGHVSGSVVCGNTRCRKVLCTYEGEGNAPNPEDSSYRLFLVQARLLYLDDYGRPLRGMPQGDPFKVLGAGLLSYQDSRVVGYRLAPGSGMMLEDFCSDRCASQYLEHTKELSLCFRMQPDGSMMFVAQRPERFPTEQVQVRLASLSSTPPLRVLAEDHPIGAGVHIERGESYGRQGKLNEAIAEFEAALRIDPNCTDAHQNLGVAYTRQGRMEEAVREYEAAVRIDPSHTRAHFYLGLAYKRMGFLKDAALQLQASLAGDPLLVKAHFHLGEAYRQMGKLGEAMREYEAAQQTDPTFSKASEFLAAARAEAKRDRRSLDYYGKRLELLRGRVRLQAGQEPPMMVRMTCLYIACPMDQLDRHTGQVKRCGRPLEIPLGLAPSAMLCPFCFALLFVDDVRRSDQYPDADMRASLKEGYTLIGYAAHPDHKAQSSLDLQIRQRTSGGQVLLAMPMTDEALGFLQLSESVVAVIPGAASPDDLANALRAPSALAAFILQSAQAAYARGRHWETVGLAQRALVIEPQSARAHFILGDAFDELGMLEAAIGEYQQALQLDPGFAMAYNDLGSVYQKQKRYEEAGRAYQAATRVDANFALAHHNLAALYQQWGLQDQAISEYQAAVRTDPNHADAHHNLGVIYLQRGRLDLAAHELQTAARLTPDDGMTHGNLGQVYWQQGRTSDAVREWQTALRLGYAPAQQWLAQVGRS